MIFAQQFKSRHSECDPDLRITPPAMLDYFQAKESTGDVCTRACSSWALIDVKSRRPVRMDAYGEKFPQSPDLSALPDVRPGKVVLPDSFDGKEERITVSPADLDYNHHVNNIRYLVWLMMYQEESFLEQMELGELNIAFLGETASGDRLILRGSSVGESEKIYSFQREADGKEVCRMFTLWRNRVS